MRIAQLANFYSPTSGGLRVAVDHLAAGYRRTGAQTTLIVPDVADHVVLDAMGSGRRSIGAPLLPNGSGYRVITSRRKVLDALDRADPDVIEVHDKLLQRWVWNWARQRAVPVIAVSHERLDATLRELAPRLPKAWTDVVAAGVARRVLNECDRLVVCSRFAAAEFGPDVRVRVVPLGVDLNRFRDHRLSTSTGQQVVRLISVGRLSWEKRPDIAIEALRELLRRGVRAELTLIGTGPLAHRLRHRSIGLPVRFVGHVTGVESVARLISAADIALCPGPAETFGLAALESLACGTPIVAAGTAATAEFIPDNPLAGRACELSGRAFADGVQALLELAPDCRRAGARTVARRYAWHATVERMRAVHAEVLTEPQSVAGGSPNAAENRSEAIFARGTSTPSSAARSSASARSTSPRSRT